MTRTWLPSDTRQRIQDLIKDSSVTQAELAGIIGLSESALSRYLKGQTEMLGDGYIIKIAKYFNVSTDFILGETNIPDRKNYDIEELGLSAESAKLLYTGKIDARILNLLLENPRFPQLTALLARYQNEVVKSGIAASLVSVQFCRYADAFAGSAKPAESDYPDCSAEAEASGGDAYASAYGAPAPVPSPAAAPAAAPWLRPGIPRPLSD